MVRVTLCDALPLEGGFTMRECHFFINLFEKQGKTRYLEFGSGLSTILAALKSKHVVSIEGDRAWFTNTSLKLKQYKLSASVDLRFANVGPTRAFSYPLFNNVSAHDYVKPLRSLETFDLILVDGRFRVACAAYAYHRLNRRGRVLLHDYRGRPSYHQINRIYNLVGFVGSLGLFEPKLGKNPLQLFARHIHDPN